MSCADWLDRDDVAYHGFAIDVYSYFSKNLCKQVSKRMHLNKACIK